MAKKPPKTPTNASRSSQRRDARRQRETQRQRQRYLAIGIVIAGAIILVSLILWSNRPISVDNLELRTTQPPGADGLAWGGPEGAPVVVVDYSDFQCPFCARHAQETLPTLIDRYGDNPNVRYEFHPYAFIGQESVDAAMAALCASEQAMFWPYHDTLYANQRGENLGQFSPANLKAMAKALGLDMGAFNDCFDSGRERVTVNDYLQEGRARGVTSTPMFFVNDVLIQGAQPASAFISAIDSALTQAGVQ